MPRKKYEEGQMLNSAAKFWHNSIIASVPQCLRAAKFTNEESGDRALQMKLQKYVSLFCSQTKISSLKDLFTTNLDGHFT